MSENTLKTIEILGLLLGISYVIGAIFEQKWCWFVGILASIFYAISVFHYKLYGEFFLQFFYVGVSIYGLFTWSKNTNSESLAISYSSFKLFLQIIAVGSLLTLLFYFLLHYFGGSFPFWDALTNGFGITTTYLTARKKIENWLFWIIIDAILSYILYLKGMPFYSALYFIYLLFAIYGFFQWKMSLKKAPIEQ